MAASDWSTPPTCPVPGAYKNGNGSFKSWATVIVAVIALLGSIFANAKDTPTRDEMERKDGELHESIRIEMGRIEANILYRLTRIEQKIDQEGKP